MDECAAARTAAVTYTNRANAQLKLAPAHALGALADCERAMSLSPSYAKAAHWKKQALAALGKAPSDRRDDIDHAEWSVATAMQRNAPLVTGDNSDAPSVRNVRFADAAPSATAASVSAKFEEIRCECIWRALSDRQHGWGGWLQCSTCRAPGDPWRRGRRRQRGPSCSSTSRTCPCSASISGTR